MINIFLSVVLAIATFIISSTAYAYDTEKTQQLIDVLQTIACHAEEWEVYSDTSPQQEAHIIQQCKNKAQEIDLLLKLQADPNTVFTFQNVSKTTPLHAACHLPFYPSYFIVPILLIHQASIYTQDINDNTPLHIACVQDNLNIIEALIGYCYWLNASAYEKLTIANDDEKFTNTCLTTLLCLKNLEKETNKKMGRYLKVDVLLKAIPYHQIEGLFNAACIFEKNKYLKKNLPASAAFHQIIAIKNNNNKSAYSLTHDSEIRHLLLSVATIGRTMKACPVIDLIAQLLNKKKEIIADDALLTVIELNDGLEVLLNFTNAPLPQ